MPLSAATLTRLRLVPRISQADLREKLDLDLQMATLREQAKMLQVKIDSLNEEIKYRLEAGQALEPGPLYPTLKEHKGNPSYKTWIEATFGTDAASRAAKEAPRSISTFVRVLSRLVAS